MGRIVLIVVAALWLAAPASGQDIQVVNRANAPTPVLRLIERASSWEVNRKLRPIWRTPPVRFHAGSNAWKLYIDPPPPIPIVNTGPAELVSQVTGWHDVNATGHPTIEVYWQRDWGIGNASTFSHELIETLVDPSSTARRAGYQLEICDPVADDGFVTPPWDPNGGEYQLADFVYPAWFRAGSSGPFDLDHVASRPFDTTWGYAP